MKKIVWIILLLMLPLAYGVSTASAVSDEPLNQEQSEDEFGFLSFAATSEVAHWDKETAKTEVFKAMQNQIDMSQTPTQDPKFLDNAFAIRISKDRLSDRKLFPFAKGGYAVSRQCEHKAYLYSKTGKLSGVIVGSMPFNPKVSICPVTYPFKVYKYSSKGNLVRVGLYVAPNEIYIYKPDGKFDKHLTAKQI